MKEYFTLNDFPFTFLFEPWVVNTALTLAFTSISVGVIALLFEGIRVIRVWIKHQFHVSPLYPVLPRRLTDSSSSDSDAVIPTNQSYIKANRIRNHILQTLLHVVRVALGYFLMLSFMSYNAYVGIGILLGACIGYFIFCHELTRWHEPDICHSMAPASSLKASTTNSSLPSEEAHPMLEATTTCTSAPIHDC